MSVIVAGVTPGSTLIAVECDPTAFSLLAKGESPSDGCDSRHNAVLFSDQGGFATATLHPQAVMTTALGAADCRSTQCFVAVESYYSPAGGNAILVDDISFSPDACAAVGSCQVPADAFDPSLGPGPALTAPAAPRAPAVGTPGQSIGRTRGSATVGHPLTVGVTAGVAGDLGQPDAVTGPYAKRFTNAVVPPTPVGGEGLLRLALTAPHTSWAAAQPSSTVVDVTLDDVTTSSTVSTQQLVLFDGTSPFVYAGFTGPVTTADRYRVTITAEPSHTDGGLSWPSGSSMPAATLVDSQLEVVPRTNPRYLAFAYAPVMFGRSTSALHDVPLLTDATATPAGNGATHLSYTVIWSHEDAGTGFVPFLESGTWGRMTDIEDAISFTVASDGTVSGATYLWGGEPPTGFPDSQGAIVEEDVPFTGQWDGTHPVIRDATGNNDFSDAGTTPFRFQMAPVPGPATGQARESVMDASPFTYRISGQEVGRWYGDLSSDPRSPELGDLRQYATVDVDATGAGVTSLAVELQLSGGPAWYASDFFSGYPAHGAGHFRTMVKLPEGWQSQSITGVRVAAYPASAASTVTISSLEVLALERNWDLVTETIPRPVVSAGATAIASQLDLSPVAGNDQVVRVGGVSKALDVRVTDALGEPLVGASVTFSIGNQGAVFEPCGCSTVSATTGPHGIARSPRARAASTPGSVPVTASTGDSVSAPVPFSLTAG